MAHSAWPGLAALLTLLVLLSGSVSAKRAMLQSDEALSNSNGCLDTIPKCEPGACATRNIMGTARWVCLRCLANYAPVVDSSGQDNIVQCGEAWEGMCGMQSWFLHSSWDSAMQTCWECVLAGWHAARQVAPAVTHWVQVQR